MRLTKLALGACLLALTLSKAGDSELMDPYGTPMPLNHGAPRAEPKAPAEPADEAEPDDPKPKDKGKSKRRHKRDTDDQRDTDDSEETALAMAG